MVKNPPFNAGDTSSVPPVLSLVLEHLTCLSVTKPESCDFWAHVAQLLMLTCPRSCAPQQEKPLQWGALTSDLESNPCSPQLEKVHAQQWRPSTVQFSCSVVSRLPCPSPTPWACSNICPSSWWCHPTISSSVVPFSSCLQSFPASGSFLMSQFFASGGQSIGASASVLPMNIQDWFPKSKQNQNWSILFCAVNVWCATQISLALLHNGTTYFPNCWNACGIVFLSGNCPLLYTQ